MHGFFQFALSDAIQVLILIAISVQGAVALIAFRKQRELENARATFSAIHNLADNVSDAAVTVYQHYEEGGFDFEKSGQEQEVNLAKFLDYLEDIAVGVNMGVYDVKIVNRVMGTQIVRANQKFGYFIDGIRERQGSQTYYTDLRLLAAKIDCLRRVKSVESSLSSEYSRLLLDSQKQGMKLTAAEQKSLAAGGK